jgi:hypothetical protein
MFRPDLERTGNLKPKGGTLRIGGRLFRLANQPVYLVQPAKAPLVVIPIAPPEWVDSDRHRQQNGISPPFQLPRQATSFEVA